jgi:hypothetical protein
MQYVIPFGLGLLWMTLTGIQTKLLVRSKSDILLMIWALITSLIWGYLVRTVVISPTAIIPYAIGTAFGAFFARRIGKHLESK